MEGGRSIRSSAVLGEVHPSLLRGICPVPTTLAPLWLAGRESYPQKCSGSWQPSPSPRNKSKSFDTPMDPPFL